MFVETRRAAARSLAGIFDYILLLQSQRVNFRPNPLVKGRVILAILGKNY